MRIGVDGRVLTDHYPGIGRALYAVLPALAAGDDTIVLFHSGENRSDRFPLASLEAAGIEIHDIGLDLRTVREQLALPAAIRRLKLDVVFTPYFATAFVWPCPRVTSVHDLIPLTVRASMPRKMSRLAFRLALRAALLSSRLITTGSTAAAQELARYAPRMRSRIRVVPHAVDPRFVPAEKNEIQAVRSRYQLGPDHLLVVAGDRPHKNLDALVAAWVAAQAEHALNSILVLAGSPPHPCDHPSVRVLGEVPEVELPSLYSSACAVVVPSLDEGFGLPAAESMACHTALVCSDRPALREVAGEAALYFDPLDGASISAALTRIIQDADQRNLLVERGRRQTTHLTPQLVAAQLHQVLKSACRGDQ